MDLSIALWTDSLTSAEPAIRAIAGLLTGAGVQFEFLLAGSHNEGESASITLGGHTIKPVHAGSEQFAAQFRAVRDICRGRWLVTLHDPSEHDAALVFAFWHRRETADLLVASRYGQGGAHRMPWLRSAVSRALNTLYRVGLSVPIRDLSSAQRMYRAAVLRNVEIRGHDYEALMESLLRVMEMGGTVAEVPWYFESPARGHWNNRSAIRLFRSCLGTFWRMHALRNSVDFPDYDFRAYDSRIWLQRHWQRRRFQIVREFGGHTGFTLDAGCGSSRIITTRPDMIALDINFQRLRFLKPSNPRRLQATAGALPFPSDSFDTVISSQVIEHTYETTCIAEAVRVLRPGGILVMGTPDYGTFWWPITEKIYGWVKTGGYADEHVSHYTKESLCREIERCGCELLRHAYIGGGELIVQARKRMT